MKKVIFSRLNFFIMIFILVGCETMAANYSASQRSSDITRFAVEIISNPPGAKIEINNDYIGKTPVTVELEGWEATRTFTRSHTIAAHPLKAGGYSQVKVFSGWREASRTDGDIVPKKFF